LPAAGRRFFQYSVLKLFPLLPYIRILRPLNAALTFASVIVAAVLSEKISQINWLAVCFGALAAAVIAAAGNVHNDILDLEVDKINRPERPLPRGDISPRAASNLSGLLFLTGIIIGFFLGQIPALITLTASLMLMAYNHRLKMIPLLGNITVSLLTALAFIFGAVLAGNPAGGIIPAVFALLFHFSREVVKDMADITGDQARPGQTYAGKYGLTAAAKLARLTLIALIIIVPLPYFAKLYQIAYLIICLIGVEIPLVWALFRLKNLQKENLSLISKVLKAGMVMGLAALGVGR